MIPVVLGAAYYSQCLPPNSYINVLDSPKAPADYLHYLDQNVGYYNKYFAWKRYYRIETFEYGWPYDLLCDVCHGLHRLRNQTNVHTDFFEWWTSGSEEPATFY